MALHLGVKLIIHIGAIVGNLGAVECRKLPADGGTSAARVRLFQIDTNYNCNVQCVYCHSSRHELIARGVEGFGDLEERADVAIAARDARQLPITRPTLH